ncbi:MAG: hypothetical protein V4709_06900 [Pseudomonadota bacterium]
MKNWLLPLAAVVVLAGLFLWMRPAPPPAAAPGAVAATPSPSPSLAVVPAPAAPVVQVFELVVKEKKLLSGPAVLSVVQGTPVTLRITVDHHDELHLHGYDLTLKLPTAQAAELSFVADKSGRFEYELHHSHVDLGVLEVQPQ